VGLIQEQRMTSLDREFAYWQRRLEADSQEAESRMRLETKAAVMSAILCLIFAGAGLVYLWTR
jgi:hypothetical protein